MTPVEATQEQMEYWAVRDGTRIERVVIGGPEEGDDVYPCPALVSHDQPLLRVHVAFRLDEIEVATLAQGGTLWLSTWGGLPIHLVEVLPRVT